MLSEAVGEVDLETERGGTECCNDSINSSSVFSLKTSSTHYHILHM